MKRRTLALWIPGIAVGASGLWYYRRNFKSQTNTDNKPEPSAVNPAKELRFNEPPYPKSDVFVSAKWAPKSEIIRFARDSDNWPLTWGADDQLYTSYGDGHGFTPEVGPKLSLGMAKVSGIPPRISGDNITPTTAEFRGEGKTGKKASSMLMVAGVLYMLVRNDNQDGEGSRIGSSIDNGITWEWTDWSFESFGYCAFLNFGRNYAGARDDFIYIYSHDNPSAYRNADHFMLMRVHRDKLFSRDDYVFFSGLESGKPIWSKNLADRKPVFTHTGRCYRSSISFSPGTKRYIWWQHNAPDGVDARTTLAGFGVYEGPSPWGPWRTVYFTHQWDVGPGETGSFPTKWMNASGSQMHLVFSGNDQFSVRKLTVELSAGSH